MNIVEPLALKNTYYGGKTKPSDNECRSYKYRGNWILESETDMSIPLGAGGIVSTPTDLTKFGDALFGGKLLKPESLELMKTMEDGYGIGLFKFPFYDKVGYGHNGGIDGFSSVFSHFPKENVSYAFTSNGANYSTNNISIAVLSAVFGYSFEIPTFNNYSVTSEELDKYLGVYTSEEISLEITITKEGNTLIAQGTGQPALPLEATEKDKFKYDQVNAVFHFNPEDNTMLLIQGGGKIPFTKK
jgi:CubicO group peptidase (beta-lactamase class C family)